MDNGQLLGKRKKKLSRSPNPLFLKWLTEWRDEASEKGWKSAYNYSKAINSLKKYPLPLATGKDCKFLEHFGDKTCQMLDRKLAEYIAENGGALPAIPEIDEADDATPVKKRKKKKKSQGTPPAAAVGVAAVVDRGVPATDVAPQAAGAKKKTPRKEKEYIPAYRSGAYAILITLYDDYQLPHSKGYMTKKELSQDAQGLADKSFTLPDPGSRYTSWSSMGTLIKKGFIRKESSPAKYSITEAGCDLAQRILAAENVQGGGGTHGENVPQFTMGAASPVKKKPSPAKKAAASRKRTPKKKPQTPANDMVTYKSPKKKPAAVGYRDHSISDSEDEDVVELPDVPSPTREEESDYMYGADNPDQSILAISGLTFTYIDEQGMEVKRKDQAAVLVDEELSFGLLIRCNYYDLLVSPLRYKLDNTRSRAGTDVYAHIHHEDAAVCSNLPKEKPKSAAPKPSTVTSHREVETEPRPGPSTSTSSKESTCSQASTAPKKKSKSKSKAATAPVLPQPLEAIPEEPSPYYPPSLASSSSHATTDTYSLDSQSSVGSVESTASIPVPKFSFLPGQFEVILCVDNREHFGAGCSKKNLLPELMRNGVECDIRNLTVGDFAWIARERVVPLPGQLKLPKGRELILDFIVERKRMDDLASSIKDGRFKEQKFRLKQCGLRKPIYLVEKFGSAQNLSLPEDTLNQAITNTQIIDGFFIKTTNDQKESVAYLTIMTRYLQQCIQRKTLIACAKDDMDENENFDITSRELRLMTFDEFNKCSVKNQALTVKEHFGKQLMQIHRMSQDRALVILEKYGTPSRLLTAYDQCSTAHERENLLSNLRCGAANRSFGPALSKVVSQLYTTRGALQA